MSTHQLANSKHCRASGQELVEKQSATWRRQEDTALPQPGLSLKTGKGLEHHFPHSYSQAGTGTLEMHCVAENTFVVDVLRVVSEADEVISFDVETWRLDLKLNVEVVVVFDGELETEVLLEEVTDLVNEELCEVMLVEE